MIFDVYSLWDQDFCYDKVEMMMRVEWSGLCIVSSLVIVIFDFCRLLEINKLERVTGDSNT
jgi:hypothetical protein